MTSSKLHRHSLSIALLMLALTGCSKDPSGMEASDTETCTTDADSPAECACLCGTPDGGGEQVYCGESPLCGE